MLIDQVIQFLQAAVVFLLLTNAVSGLVAIYAMRVAKAYSRPVAPDSAIARRVDALIRSAR
jgi:hypothetical protein